MNFVINDEYITSNPIEKKFELIDKAFDLWIVMKED